MFSVGALHFLLAIPTSPWLTRCTHRHLPSCFASRNASATRSSAGPSYGLPGQPPTLGGNPSSGAFLRRPVVYFTPALTRSSAGPSLWTTGTTPQHRVPHNVKWTSFAPPGWTNFAPPLTSWFSPISPEPRHEGPSDPSTGQRCSARHQCLRAALGARPCEPRRP